MQIKPISLLIPQGVLEVARARHGDAERGLTVAQARAETAAQTVQQTGLAVQMAEHRLERAVLMAPSQQAARDASMLKEAGSTHAGRVDVAV